MEQTVDNKDMLMLMELAWPWIIGGGLLMGWGNSLIGFGWRDWIEFLINWPILLVREDTTKEKRDLKEMELGDELAANPGCALLVVGGLCLMYGLFRWLA